jgi:uncharacterized protein YjiS (DUF1127 family)
MHIGNQSFAENGSRQARLSRAETWRRAIGTAIASASEGVMEGYALQAMALHPQYWPLFEEGSRANPPREERRNEGHPPIRLRHRSQTAMKVSSFEPHETMEWVSPRAIPEKGAARWRDWVRSLPGKLWSWIREANAHRRDVEALQALDDRTLKDMGISRAEIGYLVRHGHTWR